MNLPDRKGLNMARTKALFLSDIHLSSQARYDNTEFPTNYKPAAHTPRLIGFLTKYLAENKQKLKDVVLLGDIFDTWACPAKELPPKVEDIAAANQEVIAAFKTIMAEGIKLFFIEGNHDHDSDASRQKVADAIAGVIIAKHYLNGRIYAVHGHDYDIFNKLDYTADPGNGIPIGYFITRLSNTIPGGADAPRNLPAYLDDLLEATFTRQNLFSSMIEALAEKAGLSENDGVFLPDGRKVSIAELKTRYAVLGEEYTPDQVIANLYARRYMDVPADRLCHENQYKIVVFGHTHKRYMDKDWLFVDDRIYANTGAWCLDDAHCVEVDHRPGKPSRVKIYQVADDGSYSLFAEESV